MDHAALSLRKEKRLGYCPSRLRNKSRCLKSVGRLSQSEVQMHYTQRA